MNNKHDDLLNNVAISRRDLLKFMAAAGTAGILPHAAHASPQKIHTSARIVIAGAGAAGLACASRLAASLDGAKITLIDARQRHLYQPGFTLIGGGIKPLNYSISSTAGYIPKGVDWIQTHVTEFDPDSNAVVTDQGRRIPYDYLIVTTGLQLEYGEIEGMSPDLIGKHGIASIYHSPEAAAASWQALSAFTARGGRGIFTRPNTEMKCSGAPLKYTFISEDRLVRAGTRSKSEIVYNSNNNVLFSVPIVSEKVRMLFESRNIAINRNRILKAVDPGKKIALFHTPDGLEEQPYDFIHVIPPQRAPTAVRNSPLPVQEGIWLNEGWLDVDKHTLRHKRYPNVFGVGDIAGVPKGKTAASVKWQVPVAVAHLIADITGTSSDARYDGYTSCPLITQLGRAMLVEFDYENNLTPSFPGVISPLEELWTTWVIKTMGLKPTYLSMLRGQA